MDKIYGYKQSDVVALAKEVLNRGNRSLSSVFESFSLRTGKAKGTVRNMYYALAKESRENPEFSKSVLDGKTLSVSKIVEFDKSDERDLLKKVLTAKREGKSARRAIMELSNGDMKLALRLQNKFRNTLKLNTQLVSEVVSEINSERGDDILENAKESAKSPVSEFQFKRLKKEIDGLVERISQKARKENAYLRERVSALELENLRLTNILYGSNRTQKPSEGIPSALDFFAEKKGRNMLN